MIPVYIGYDSRMDLVSSVLIHSINVRASEPVQFTLLNLNQLKKVFHRELHALQSTEFSFSRFLVPYLSNYEGFSIFMDNDMIMLDDIANLWALRDENHAVQVVHHTHQPKEDTKFLGEKQTRYEKKNWSSVMLFNNTKCQALTPEYVNTASGLELHQFKWLKDDSQIGELPHRWNHLVDYDPHSKDVSLLHYTLGGPYHAAYTDCDYRQEWNQEFEDMQHIIQKKMAK